MDRTDNGPVGRRQLLEGTTLEHELLPAWLVELGSEAELLVEMNDLVDRLLLRDRRKRWRLADKVRAPCPSSSSARRSGRAPSQRGGWRGPVQAGDGWRARVCRAARPRPRRGRVAGRAGALLASCRDEACLGKDAKVRADGVPCAARRAFQAHGRRGEPRLPVRLRGSARGLGRSELGGIPCRVEQLPGARSLSRADRIHLCGVKMILIVFTDRITIST